MGDKVKLVTTAAKQDGDVIIEVPEGSGNGELEMKNVRAEKGRACGP